MSDQETFLPGHPSRAAPDEFAMSLRASRSTGIRRRRRPASEHLESRPQATGSVAAMKLAKLCRTTVGMFRATDAKEHRGVIPLCDTSPARWAQRSCMTAAVSRDIRGLTKDACGSKAWATLGTTTSSEPRQE